MNFEMDVLNEEEIEEEKKPFPWLKIGIIAAILVIAIIIFFLIKGCSGNYIITFDTMGGSLINGQTVSKGDYIIKPIDPVKEGYVFNGWYYNDIPYDFNAEVKNDMTLVATWEEIQVLYYLVTFDTDGGSYIASQEIEENKTVTRPADPVKSGYKFLGWYLDDTEYDFESKVVEDIILTAKWKSTSSGEATTPTKYTVAFNSNGGSLVSSQSITKGGKVSKPANPTRGNYEFLGWYYNGKPYDFNSSVTKSITLVAQWSAHPTYTVTFDTVGGSQVPKQNVKEGEKIIKPVDPTKANHVFQGWYYNGEEYDFNVGLVSNITLTAKWKENQKYTVTFVTNGGSNVATQTVYINGKVNKPANPTRTNYTFEAWYTTSGKEYNFNKPVTSNLTLYADWKSKYDFEFNIYGYSGGQFQVKNVNLPDGYIIKYMEGNKTTSEVINSGKTLGEAGYVYPTLLYGTGHGFYTFVATLNNQELVTKKIYYSIVLNVDYKTSSPTIDLDGFIKVGKTYGTATNASFSNSKLFVRSEAAGCVCCSGSYINGVCHACWKSCDHKYLIELE